MHKGAGISAIPAPFCPKRLTYATLLSLAILLFCRAAVLGWISPLRAERSSSDTAVKRSPAAAVAVLAFLTAVRNAERWARLRMAAARDFRRSFFADLIFGTETLQQQKRKKYHTGSRSGSPGNARRLSTE